MRDRSLGARIVVIWTERGQHCAPALQDAEVRYGHVILSEEVRSQSGGLGTRGWGSGTQSLAPSTQFPSGGMGERLKPAVLKTVSLARGSGVRIPLPPPAYRLARKHLTAFY